MFGNFFYHATLEKVTKAFGSLFKNIYVVRLQNGEEVERMLVPISYANRHSYIQRKEQQPQLEDDVFVEAKFPRMAFQIVAMNYDSARKLNTIHRHRSDQATDSTRNSAYQSVPYNVVYELLVVAKHITDANQIIEQILPYFAPSYTLTIAAVPEMGYVEDLVIELQAVNFQDNYQEEMASQRIVQFSLTFVARTHFHGPVAQSKLIKKTQVDLHIPKDLTPQGMNVAPRVERYEVEPRPANALPTDDFGYTEQWTAYDDGKKYDPVTDTDVDVPEE